MYSGNPYGGYGQGAPYQYYQGYSAQNQMDYYPGNQQQANYAGYNQNIPMYGNPIYGQQNPNYGLNAYGNFPNIPPTTIDPNNPTAAVYKKPIENPQHIPHNIPLANYPERVNIENKPKVTVQANEQKKVNYIVAEPPMLPNQQNPYIPSSQNLIKNNAIPVKQEQPKIQYVEVPAEKFVETRRVEQPLPKPTELVAHQIQDKKIIVTSEQLKSKPQQLCNEEFDFQEVKFKSCYGDSRYCIYRKEQKPILITSIFKNSIIKKLNFKSRFEKIFPTAKEFNHPVFVKPKAIYENLKEINICSEIPKGKNLLSILDKEDFSEPELAEIVRILVRYADVALGKLIDLPKIKLENLYLDRSNSSVQVQLFDYGLFLVEDFINYYSDKISDIIYYSPAYIKSKVIDFKSIMWGIGIILCLLSTGSLPFRLCESKLLVSSILNFKFDNSYLENFKIYSEEMKSFIKLIFECNDSLTVSNILLHKWLLNPIKSHSDVSTNTFLNNIKGLKHNFKSIITLQTNILNYVVYNYNLNEIIQTIRNECEKRDGQLSGYLSSGECFKIISVVMPTSILTQAEIESVVDRIPADQYKRISYIVLISEIINYSLKFFEHSFKELFEGIENQNGQISTKIIRAMIDISSKYFREGLKLMLGDIVDEEIVRYIDVIHSLYTHYKVKSTKINL